MLSINFLSKAKPISIKSTNRTLIQANEYCYQLDIC
jgi:hypothetical protein